MKPKLIATLVGLVVSLVFVLPVSTFSTIKANPVKYPGIPDYDPILDMKVCICPTLENYGCTCSINL